jgi:hypothetical protein
MAGPERVGPQPGDKTRIPVPLISVLGVVVACPLLVAVILRFELDAAPLLALIAFAAYPIFVIALTVLVFVAWRAATVYQLPKMEVWWWLSAPYSVTFALYFELLHLERFAVHALPLFILFPIMTAVSTAVWILVSLCQVAISRRLAIPRRIMLGFALLLVPIVWMSRR